MPAHFVEFPGFTDAVISYFVTDDAYWKLQRYLVDNPTAGTLIRQAGGIRKLRWPDPRRGKGKRSGLRIWYLYTPEFDDFLMIDIYDKDEADDLSASQRKIVAAYAEQYRKGLSNRKES